MRFSFHFSRDLVEVVDYVNVKSSAGMTVNHALRYAQKVCAPCALTKVGIPSSPPKTTFLSQSLGAYLI